MKITSRRPVAILLSTLFGLVVSTAALVSAADAENKPLEVCKDINGNMRSGDLDVLLLLDNSKSLNTDISKPTDGENKRYGAIASMLESFSRLTEENESQGAWKINFGMVTFGSRARLAIPMESLTTANSQSLGKRVQSETPKNRQESSTDYVVALETALKVLKDRPRDNCKFLVWFTDGQYAERSLPDAEKQREAEEGRQARTLGEAICGSGGLADRFQKERINTFVLVLKPSVENDLRLNASYGAMQAITGATSVPDQVKGNSDSELCGNREPLEDRAHLGEILVADDATDIARVISVIAPPPTTAVTECPIRSNGSDLPAMPAARHLSSLTFSAYTDEAELRELKSLTIVEANGTKHPAADFFTEGNPSDYQQKFFVKSSANRELDQGWTFSLGGQEVGWCVQADPHQFEVQFVGSGVVQLSTGGELNAADLDSLEYRLDSDRTRVISDDVARTSPEKVVGFLDIDPTDKVIREPIQVKVRQSNVLTLSCESFELRDSLGRDIPESRRIGSRCLVDTTTSRITNVNVTLNPSQLEKLDQQLSKSDCNSTVGLIRADESDQSPAGPLLKSLKLEDKSISTLWVVLEAEGRSALCSVEASSAVLIEFTKQDESGNPLQDSKALDVVIDLRWERVPIWWVVVAITLAALLAIALLVLVILGRLSRATSRLPKPGSVMAYEVPLRLQTSRSGLRALAADGTDLRNHEFAVSSLIRVDVSPSRRIAHLVGGTRSSLEIKYPSLFRPFDLPRLVLDSESPAEYWPATNGRGGLSPMATSGVIVHSPRHSAQSTQAVATILVPSSGDRAAVVRDLLASKIEKALAPVANSDKWRTLNSQTSASNESSPRPPNSGTSGDDTRSITPTQDPVDDGNTPQPRRGPPRIGG